MLFPPLVVMCIGGIVGSKSSKFRLCLETGTNVERFIGNFIEFSCAVLVLIPDELVNAGEASMAFCRNE